MARQLLCVALLSVMVAACSSQPLDPSYEQGSTEADVGSVNLPLTTKVGSDMYRLNKAVFTVTGEALGAKPRYVKPLPDIEVHNEKLPVGTFSILLEKGWVLEKKAAGAAAFVVVPATLVTQNPLVFTVDGKTPGDAFFGFSTTSGEVSLGDGSVNIRIGVQDCSQYDSYMASLGELTARCLGTIDPRAYSVTADGILTPNFTACTEDKRLMRSIRQLLSLQHRTVSLPFVKQCMVGRYSAALQKFQSSGVEVCPTWQKLQVVNPINIDTIQKISGALPELPAKDGAFPRDVMESLKENSIYGLKWPNGQQPSQQCDTAADCANVCASVFPGFVVGKPLSSESVLTDPPAWQLETVYGDEASDPYLNVNYYHPMSYYLGKPGVQFGEYARFDPCGGESCEPEACSYYSGLHLKTFLQRNCLDNGDLDTCVSFCGPPR